MKMRVPLMAAAGLFVCSAIPYAIAAVVYDPCAECVHGNSPTCGTPNGTPICQSNSGTCTADTYFCIKTVDVDSDYCLPHGTRPPGQSRECAWSTVAQTLCGRLIKYKVCGDGPNYLCQVQSTCDPISLYVPPCLGDYYYSGPCGG